MPDFNTAVVLFLSFLVIQRLSELFIAKRNTKALLKKGAVEVGANHYPIMVGMHTTWVIALMVLGLNQTVSLAWLSLFIILQFFRLWILTRLGSRWTTRIIILNEPLVVTGPFRYFRHPNYMLVVAEIFVAPAVLGLWWIAILFSVLNALMLWLRIGVEEGALKDLR